MQIQLSPSYFVDVSNWTLIRVSQKSSGELKEKMLTFNNLYQMIRTVKAGNYGEDASPETKEQLNTFIARYESIMKGFRSALPHHKGEKIEFSVSSVTGGPDHFCASLKNHGQIEMSTTYYSNNRLAKGGYSINKTFPGNHFFAAQTVFEQELSNILLVNHTDATFMDLIKEMDVAEDKVLTGLHAAKQSRFSNVDHSDMEDDVEIEDEVEIE